MTPLAVAVLIVFIAAYAGVIIFKRWRAQSLWVGIAVLWIAGRVLGDPKGYLSLHGIFVDAVNWNVLGIFTGAMLIAELFTESRVPAFLANRVLSRAPNVGLAMLLICILGSFISMFVDNVSTVLIVSPVALEVSRRLKISPVPFLIGLAISSNLQGTATLVGDPPSMLLAKYKHMSFNDFIFMKSAVTGAWKPSIFFAVQVGAVASFTVLYLLFRRNSQPVGGAIPARVTSWVPTVLLVCMLTTLALGSLIDPNFTWFAGTATVCWGVVGVVWASTHHGWGPTTKILARYDVATLFFLAGVFILAYTMERSGHVVRIAALIKSMVGDSPGSAFLAIVGFSVVISAFLDNIPYTALMLPVVTSLAHGMGMGSDSLFAFGLLVGACLGGNITPVGASANVVAVGLLRREGIHVSFWEFAKYGVPFTLAGTAAGGLFLWFVWGP